MRGKQKNRLVPDFSRNDRSYFLNIASQAVVGLISKTSKYTLNERQPCMKYVNFGNEYVHFEGVRFICGQHLVIIHIGKIRASNES